jgi:hypothetical protein
MKETLNNTESSNSTKPVLAVAFYHKRYVDSFKPTHEQIKFSIKLLIGKEQISVKELQDNFKCDYNWASTMMDILEDNQIVSSFIGKTHRIILLDQKTLKRQILVENFEDFDI